MFNISSPLLSVSMDLSNLQSRVSTAYIPPHRTQLHPRMHSFPSSSSSSFPKSSQISSAAAATPQSREKWWTIAAALLIIPFLFYLFAIGRGIHSSSKFDESRPKGFGIIIDAGSTGSRIHVFEFLNEGRIPFVRFDGKGSNSLKVRPGLAEFAAEPHNAGSSISSLLEFAKTSVPQTEWKNTKVWLVATTEELKSVGLELDARKAMLESCRRVLRSSGFRFKDEWASMITGQEEGLYAWVAANYALGTLGGDPQETTGIVELGEASVQVTFALKEPPPMEFSRMVKLAGVTYNLYAQTKLRFGQDAAWKLLHNSKVSTSSSVPDKGVLSSPCIPKGYGRSFNANGASNLIGEELLASVTAGNFSACRSEALALLQKGNDECLHPPCKIVPSFFPELRGSPVPPENFFYTSEFFGLVPKASLAEMEAAGKHYCEDDWEKLKDEHVGIDEMDLLRYCFSSAYVVALLHDGLGIPMNDKRIGFANQAGSIPLDWTLGAFILQTVVEPLESEPENLGHVAGNNTVTYLSLLALFLFAILAAFYVSKWRKPQLKTIYDLEKGHYIVTRIPR